MATLTTSNQQRTVQFEEAKLEPKKVKLWQNNQIINSFLPLIFLV